MSLILPLILGFLLHTISVAETECNRGSFLYTKTGTCQLCPAGFYQSQLKTTNNTCEPCPAGTYFPYKGAQTKEVCRRCPANTISKAGSSSCTKCQSGTIAKWGASKCVTCPPGKEYQFPDDNQNPCAGCRPGLYNPTQNGKCISCPRGHISKSGATSIEQCTKCPKGKGTSGGICIECNPGIEVYNLITGLCDAPKAGTVIGPDGKVILCEEGEYGFAPGADIGFIQTVCEKCPKGTTTYSKGMKFCRAIGFECPSNYAVLPSGDCFSCEEYERFDKANSKCVNCPSGFASRGGGDETCRPCEMWVKEGIRSYVCSELEKFIPRVNNKCPPGTKTSTKYKSLCEKCGVNMYSIKTNSKECLNCPMDRIQLSAMASSCDACPKGLSRATIDDTECVVPQTGCKPGQELVGSPFVPVCADKCEGKRPAGLNHEGCFKCQPKSEPDSKNPGQCRRCGHFEASDGRKCQSCPGETIITGYFGNECGCKGFLALNRGIVNGKCKICPPGSYGKEGENGADNTCVKCRAGLVREVTSEEAALASAVNRFAKPIKPCVPCPRGFITTIEGAVKCEKCPEGTTSYGLGEIECVPKVDITSSNNVDVDPSVTEPPTEPMLEESPEGTLDTDLPEPTHGEILFPELGLELDKELMQKS